MRSYFLRTISLILFFLPSVLIAQNVPFTQRDTWDGPFDIKMISGVNLQPVFIDPIQAELGGTSQGYLLADSIISDGVMQRTGDLFEINNRYKDGSSNSVFEQYDIPLPAILCQGDPNVGGCIEGLVPTSNNSSCPAPATRYDSSPDEISDVYVSMTYSDYDTDNSTFSSSMAALDISSCSEIEAAYLYWSGNFEGGNNPITLVPGPLNSYSGTGNVFNATTSPSSYNMVKFKIPGGNYQEVTAATEYTSSTTYVCVADVTNRLNGLQGGGEFWVGNLRSYPIEGNGGSTSGWTLVVVFRSPLSPPRLINLWDGFKNIGSGDEEVFNLTGLQAPASTNFRSYVGFAALDGENLATQLDGDTPEGLGFKTNGGTAVDINPFETDQAPYKLYNKKGYPATCSESDNLESNCRVPAYDNDWCSVFDGVSSSHITSYDELTGLNGNEITRIPSNINTLGYDAHHMLLPPGAVSPGATDATLTVRAGPQGSTLPFLAYVAIERLQPKLAMSKTADKDATELSTQIQYTLTIKNEGNAPSMGGDIIYDTLDAATTFTPSSLSASQPGVTLEASASNQLQIKLANSIAEGDSVVIQFLVDVIPFATNPSLFNPPNCKRTIENTAFIEYNTISSGILQNKSNSNDCGIGNETRVVLVDEQLTSSTTTPLGPFDGCGVDSDDAYERIRLELTNNGVSASMLDQFDIRDSNYVRIRPGDVFGEVDNEKVYYAIQDITGGASCQEVYELTFQCETCTVSVTSPSRISVCSGTALNYTITSDVTGATFSWDRAAVTGISNSSVTANTANPITESLVNTSADSVLVTYDITPSATGCIGVPFELEVSVIPVATITNLDVRDTLCSGDLSAGFSVTSNVTNAAFVWQSTATNVTGATTLGTTNTIPTEELTSPLGGEVVYSVTPSLGGLCPGTVKDFTVTVHANPTVTASSDVPANTLCLGDAVVLSGAGAGSGATYTWDNSVLDGVAFSPTTSTSYKIKGVDANSCEDTTSIVVTVNELPNATLTGGKTVCDGTALELNVGLSAGKAPFTVDVLVGTLTLSLNSNATLPIDSAQGIANLAGTYSLDNLVDANGCTAAASDLNSTTSVVYITKPTAEITNPTTRAKTISTTHYQLEAAVVPTGYEGTWSNTGMGTINQSGYLSNLNKTVETDGLNAATSVVVWAVNDENNICPNALDTVDIIRREITSADAKNDTICLSTTTYSQVPVNLPNTATGEQAEWTAVGTAPAPTAGTATLEVNFTQVGSYQYTYRIYNTTLLDDFGNPVSSTKTITIVVDDIPNVSLATIDGDNFGCLDTLKNYEVINVTNADEYQWTLPTGFSGASVTSDIDVVLGDLSGGTISVIASNKACGINPTPVTLSVTDIRQIPQIKPIIDGLKEVCASYSSVVYNITNTLSDADVVTWEWNNAVKLNEVDTAQDLTLNTADFVGLTAGLIEVIPANACGKNELVKGELLVSILNEVKPKVTLASDKLNNEFCLADVDLVTFTATPISGFGDNPTYEFVVNGTGERSPISSSNQFATATINNSVTVIMTSDDVCRSQDTAMAHVNMVDISPTISLSVTSDVCAGDQATVFATINPTPTAGSSITWFNHSNEVVKAQNQLEASFTNTGNYALSATYDNGICQPMSSTKNGTDSIRFTIWEKPAIVFPALVSGDFYQVIISKKEATDLVIPVTITGVANDSMNYYWQGEGVQNAMAKNLTITYQPNQEGIYDYVLTASNINFPACSDEAIFEIQASIPLSVPNAFSPNGDGVNDWWEIPGITRYPNAQVTIFNRWGNQVYDQIGYNASTAWRGEKHPVATYYYIIKLNSEVWPEPLTGALTITR